MREIRTSGLMSGEGRRVAKAIPRPSSTLLGDPGDDGQCTSLYLFVRTTEIACLISATAAFTFKLIIASPLATVEWRGSPLTPRRAQDVTFEGRRERSTPLGWTAISSDVSEMVACSPMAASFSTSARRYAISAVS